MICPLKVQANQKHTRCCHSVSGDMLDNLECFCVCFIIERRRKIVGLYGNRSRQSDMNVASKHSRQCSVVEAMRMNENCNYRKADS